MTPLKKPVARKTQGTLDGCFGSDRGKHIVVRLVPGDGKKIPDTLELYPLRTRRIERVTVQDVYAWALRCRVNRQVLERARERKAKRAVQRERRRLDAYERRLRDAARAEQAWVDR